MKTQARAASIAVAGAAFLAASWTAGPASAAGGGTDLATTCTGTFEIVKKLKTCTSVKTFSYEGTYAYAQFSGTIRADYELAEAGSETVQFVETQKGKGPIKTLEPTLIGSTFSAIVVPGSEKCSDFDNDLGAYYDLPIEDCRALGLYPDPV
jgi:hypothetical protein